MGLPRLLLVDDSEAILAYEAAALRDRYDIATAKDGADALAQLLRGGPDALPALVLLDLSMPRMDGETLLRRLRAHPWLSTLTVLLVSSEGDRAARLVDDELVAGSLKKPIEAAVLRAAVERALDDTRARRAKAGLAVVRVVAGAVEFAVPLALVDRVVAQPLARRVDDAVAWRAEVIDVAGVDVSVVDVAACCGVAARARYVDRALVVVGDVALAVDAVADPEFVGKDDVVDGGAAVRLPRRAAPLPVLRRFDDDDALRALVAR